MALPAISKGIHGYTVKEAEEIAGKTCEEAVDATV
jgi:O-acetyl-ADP-ribose deacetylase (regulator of RNase III)